MGPGGTVPRHAVFGQSCAGPGTVPGHGFFGRRKARIEPMPDWVIWSIVAVLLGVGEMLTPGAVLSRPGRARGCGGRGRRGDRAQRSVCSCSSSSRRNRVGRSAAADRTIAPANATPSCAPGRTPSSERRRSSSRASTARRPGEDRRRGVDCATFFEEQVLEPGRGSKSQRSRARRRSSTNRRFR